MYMYSSPVSLDEPAVRLKTSRSATPTTIRDGDTPAPGVAPTGTPLGRRESQPSRKSSLAKLRQKGQVTPADSVTALTAATSTDNKVGAQ